ncbi:DUF4114 domain-containing protein [Desulfonema magnum]|uniref:Cohesin domain-containing protein, DUF4114 n=1 Tax=Desulfonema magnum TaxID=45655 RepID=A0A975GLD7_9BACT|nr:DUF4114 domain-containing protein [Desulfonema magnum]QTA84718.1 Cohesin domain-containing protein, DUF4114 [Desulfonema magnum]
MTTIKLIKAFILIALVSIVVSGHAFALPGIALDTDYTTHDYDPTDPLKDVEAVITAEANEEMRIAIVAQDAISLNAYQVAVNYDPSRMDFIEGSEDDPSQGITNLLKKNGGRTVGLHTLERTPGTVSIVNALRGRNADEAVTGSGVIALLKFRVLDSSPDNQMTLSNILLLDFEGTVYPVTVSNTRNAIHNPSSGNEEPNDPEEPEEPNDPENPEEPNDPENPEEPNDPENPEEPEEPNDPEDPNDPEEPEDPDNPGEDDELIAGVFIADDFGLITIDWLYDGGAYKGELGIFSLEGMDLTVPDLEAFIAEAVRRVLSPDDHDGGLVLSDPTDRARFSGVLGGESQDWNEGEFIGVRTFEMNPGEKFALILVPNGTFEALAANPGTTDKNKRPLFSFTSPNSDYGMHVGQVADINGKGLGFVFEDMEFTNSDRDYNDLMVQINGAVSEVPTIDEMLERFTTTASKKRSSRRDSRWHDWRTNDELGRKIMEHLEGIPGPDDLWTSVTLDASADLMVYDAEDNFSGKDGGGIPGSLIEFDAENGRQTVSLPRLTDSQAYRLVLRCMGYETGLLTIKGHEGFAEISSDSEEISTEAHQVLTTDLTLSPSGEPASFGTPDVPRAADGTPLWYDFDGDGRIDDDDINKAASFWNTCEGDLGYDPFFDLDEDGCISILDIMPVSNSKYIP